MLIIKREHSASFALVLIQIMPVLYDGFRVQNIS